MRYISLAVFTACVFGIVACFVADFIETDLNMQANAVLCFMVAIPAFFSYVIERDVAARVAAKSNKS